MNEGQKKRAVDSRVQGKDNCSRKDGSIQEDRHKVEQFHFLWNSSTNSGTASQKCGTAPPKSGTGTKNSDECHKLHAISGYDTVYHF